MEAEGGDKGKVAENEKIERVDFFQCSKFNSLRYTPPPFRPSLAPSNNKNIKMDFNKRIITIICKYLMSRNLKFSKMILQRLETVFFFLKKHFLCFLASPSSRPYFLFEKKNGGANKFFFK